MYFYFLAQAISLLLDFAHWERKMVLWVKEKVVKSAPHSWCCHTHAIHTPAPWATAREVTDLCLSFCSCKIEISWHFPSDMTRICSEILCDNQKIHASLFLFVTFCRRGVTVLYRPMLMISLYWRTKSGSTVAHSCSEQISNKAVHLPTPKEVVS